MKIERLSLHNFKSYNELSLEFDNRVNLFYGLNGSGKTNLLDAIYFLSVSKSYFSSGDGFITRHNQDFYRTHGIFKNDKSAFTVCVKRAQNDKKTIELQGKKLNTASELIGIIPIVLVAPDDIKIVKQGSKERRDFVNRMICMSHRPYLSQLITHNRVLAQKNALLKAPGSIDFDLLDQYNGQLIKLGRSISKSRATLTDQFKDYVSDTYRQISDSAEEVNIIYQSQFLSDGIADQYKALQSDEIRSKRILIGIHKDDFEFTINEKPLKKIGSQGQIKSFVYALRIGEYMYLKDHLAEKPILILDDYFEKLDTKRLELLTRFLKDDTFDQVFLSDTELDRTSSLLTKFEIPFSAYHIQNGQILKQ
jgi:DNA replication and repair protein RecF